MGLVVVCSCKKKLRIRDDQLEAKLECPFCKREFVPRARSRPVEPASSEAESQAKQTVPRHRSTAPGATAQLSRPVPKKTSPPPKTKVSDARGSSRRRLLLGGIALCLVGVVGLWLLRGNKDRRERFPVTGKVSFPEGSPLKAGFVTFFELADPGKSDNAQGMIAKGDVRSDGTYQIGSPDGKDGLPQGKYKVVVTPARPPDPSNPPRNWPPFQARFSRYNESPLEYTVVRGENRYAITVQR